MPLGPQSLCNPETVKGQNCHEIDLATITLGFIWDPSTGVWAIFWIFEGKFWWMFSWIGSLFFSSTLLFFSISFFDARGSLNDEVILLILLTIILFHLAEPCFQGFLYL